MIVSNLHDSSSLTICSPNPVLYVGLQGALYEVCEDEGYILVCITVTGVLSPELQYNATLRTLEGEGENAATGNFFHSALLPIPSHLFLPSFLLPCSYFFRLKGFHGLLS